jgi:phospholipid transport system substrate-binding protein
VNRLNTLMAATVLAVTSGVAGAAAAKLVDPDVLIKDAADRTFATIDGDRAKYEKDTAALQKVAQDILLPHFDAEYTTRLVLGKHWNAATPEQQQRFRQLFIDFLMRTYSKGMLEFQRDSIKVTPLRGATDPRRTIVRTEIRRREGQLVPVDFTLRMTPDGWKVFDITIEGISYVLNYRNSFADEIEQKGGGDARKGIDAVLARLASPGATPPPVPAKKG